MTATDNTRASGSTPQGVQTCKSSTSEQTLLDWPDPRFQSNVPATASSSSIPQRVTSLSSQPSTSDHMSRQWQNDYETYINLIKEASDEDNEDDLHSTIVSSTEDQTCCFVHKLLYQFAYVIQGIEFELEQQVNVLSLGCFYITGSFSPLSERSSVNSLSCCFYVQEGIQSVSTVVTITANIFPCIVFTDDAWRSVDGGGYIV